MTLSFVFIGEMILRRNVPSLEFGSSKVKPVSSAGHIPCGESRGPVIWKDRLNSPDLSVEVWEGIFTCNYRISPRCWNS